MKTVSHELGKVGEKWYKIGVQLGIPAHILNKFKKEDDPLIAALSYWLAGNLTVPVIPISWKSIVAALKSHSVEESGLAEDINKKYCEGESIHEIKRGTSIFKKPLIPCYSS